MHMYVRMYTYIKQINTQQFMTQLLLMLGLYSWWLSWFQLRTYFKFEKCALFITVHETGVHLHTT